jgi:hypothetical protein
MAVSTSGGILLKRPCAPNIANSVQFSRFPAEE